MNEVKIYTDMKHNTKEYENTMTSRLDLICVYVYIYIYIYRCIHACMHAYIQ